jgi:hypothetical protein
MDSICTRRASDDPASLAITKHVLLDNAEGEGVSLDGYYGISGQSRGRSADRFAGFLADNNRQLAFALVGQDNFHLACLTGPISAIRARANAVNQRERIHGKESHVGRTRPTGAKVEDRCSFR